MNRTFFVLLLSFLLALASACGDSGHSHEADGSHPPDAHGPEENTVVVTRWTDRSELFLEYPAMVAGESGRAAVHLTDLADFSPLADGQAIILLQAPDGEPLEFRGGPSRPGIFGVDLKVEQPGKYSMSLRVDAPELQDVHDLGSVTVHAPGSALPHQHAIDGEIAFLKEQQWTLEFGTAAASERGIHAGISVPATVQPRSGGEAWVSAMVSGRVLPIPGVPVSGTRVRAGTLLAKIVPHSDDLGDAASLRAVVVEAEQSHALAVKELARVQRLVQARALPGRRLDEAHASLTATAARLDAATLRLQRFDSLSDSATENPAAGTFVVRAPFDGVISEVLFSAGVTVEANDPLLRIVDPDRLQIVGTIPESLAAEIGNVSAGELNLEAQPPLKLGAPLNISPVIDPVARTIEVRFDLDNREARLRVGQSVRLQLLVGEERSVIAIPESAVVDDAGGPVVFVQRGGESFVRRPVRLGNASDGHVHVVVGVKAGERVVHRGAYLVRLASMSNQIPAHGHVH